MHRSALAPCAMALRRRSWLALAAAAAWTATLPAHAAPLPDAAAVRQFTQELLNTLKIEANHPGLTLLVARGDEVLVETARGAASIELGVAMTPQHRLRIGSVTKQFAAASLLRLVDEGRAQLSDPVAKYLPDLPRGETFTLGQLLNHTSGVASYTNLPGYMVNPVRRDLDTAALVAEFKNLPADFAPGTKWNYSNSGYVLVGAVVEAITGQPWHVALAEQIRAAGGTAVDVLYPAPERLVPKHAAGYSRSAQGVTPAGLISMTQPHAAGALVSDVRALWQWNRLLHEGAFLKPATLQQMRTPVGAAQGPNYGYGITTEQWRGAKLHSHTGGIHGFASVLSYRPAERVTVAVLANSDAPAVSPSLLARHLMAYAIGQPLPRPTPLAADPVALAQRERAAGVYRRNGEERVLRVVDGRLVWPRNAGGSTATLLPVASDRYAYGGLSAVQVQVERRADGSVGALQVFPEGDGDGERWDRLGDVPTRSTVALSAEQQQALVGDYRHPALSMKVTVGADGQLQTQVPGQPVFALRAYSPRELAVVGIDATLVFEPTEGAVQRVRLKQGGNDIPMERQR